MSSNNGPRPVQPSFERTNAGVRFNVETVVPPKGPAKDMNPTRAKDFAKDFYSLEKALSPVIEATR